MMPSLPPPPAGEMSGLGPAGQSSSLGGGDLKMLIVEGLRGMKSAAEEAGLDFNELIAEAAGGAPTSEAPLEAPMPELPLG